MKQQTLTGFERYAKTTRRAQFLADMQVIVPWAELIAVVEPFYPKISEAGGRPPLPLERMLRVYFLQLWFNLSDPAVEESLYESASMRNFAGIDGLYDFSRGDQHGLSDQSVVMASWNPKTGEFYAVSGLGGVPLKNLTNSGSGSSR